MAATSEFNRSKQEMNSFRRWLLENIMPHTIGDPEQQKEILNVKAMSILDRAFTSKTFIYDLSRNYEQFETLGDSLLSFLLELLVMEKFPHADSGQISALKGEYGNNKYQSFIMNKLGCHRFLLRAPNTELTKYGILGDVFESMFYAIFEAVKLKYPNLATNACYNLFKYFYDNDEFIRLDFKYSRGDAKTIITTKMFNKLRDRESSRNSQFPTYMAYVYEERPMGTEEKATVKVTIDLPRMKLLGMNGINISNRVYAEATALSTDVASTRVYMELLDKLEALGITEKKIDEIKFQEDISTSVAGPKYRAARAVAVNNGYLDLDFDVDQKLSKSIGENAKVLLLLGKKANGNIDVLMCGIGTQDTTKTKMMLLEAYSENKPMQMLDFRK